MSDHGYHHTSLWGTQKEKKPAPCFNCATEPRLEGHVVCSGCHDELRCNKCGGYQVAPVHLSRGATIQSERKFV